MEKKDILSIDVIEGISKLFSENNLQELYIETSEFSIKLSASRPQMFSPIMLGPASSYHFVNTPTDLSNVSQISQKNVSPVSRTTSSEDKFDDNKYLKVKSPINGIFYSSPSPSSPAFVNEGDHVSNGQTLCIVESMKVMNEIKSSASGKIVKILKKDSEVVKSGDVLFIIEMA